MAILKLQQQNVACATAYTEVAIAIPPRVNEVTIALRQNDTLYIYPTTTNGSNPGTNANLPVAPNTYTTIPPGASRTFRGQLGGQTIYAQVATTQAGQIIEVDYYGDT